MCCGLGGCSVLLNTWEGRSVCGLCGFQILWREGCLWSGGVLSPSSVCVGHYPLDGGVQVCSPLCSGENGDGGVARSWDPQWQQWWRSEEGGGSDPRLPVGPSVEAVGCICLWRLRW